MLAAQSSAGSGGLKLLYKHLAAGDALQASRRGCEVSGRAMLAHSARGADCRLKQTIAAQHWGAQLLEMRYADVEGLADGGRLKTSKF